MHAPNNLVAYNGYIYNEERCKKPITGFQRYLTTCQTLILVSSVSLSASASVSVSASAHEFASVYVCPPTTSPS